MLAHSSISFRCKFVFTHFLLFSFQGTLGILYNGITRLQNYGGLGRTRTSDLTLIRRAL
jgi:hypothetical protein